MAAVLEPIAFNHAEFEAELSALGALLDSASELSETKDIQPLFKAAKSLSAFLGIFAPRGFGPGTELAFEFPFFGDYRADLVVGNKKAGHFCVVEFEDAGPDSIFRRQPTRANPEWSSRFEHGFSQLTDWFFNLDDYKKTHGFARSFGHGHIMFTGLLIIGRSAGLDDMKRARLRWRSDKVLIDSNTISCITFDDLHDLLWKGYAYFKGALSGEKSPSASPPSE